MSTSAEESPERLDPWFPFFTCDHHAYVKDTNEQYMKCAAEKSFIVLDMISIMILVS